VGHGIQYAGVEVTLVVATDGSASEPTSDDRRICGTTGLAIVRSDGRSAWRIAKTSYGPLQPIRRGIKWDRSDWNRYDVPGHQTVYAATPTVAAYGESLAYLRAGLDKTKLSQVFVESSEDHFDGQQSIQEAVAAEWAEMNFQAPGTLNAGWRHARALYELKLPNHGWFIDIQDAESLAALRRRLSHPLRVLDVSTLTLSHLTGEDRRLTTAIADWLWRVTLEDGQTAHGIKYSSKYGSNWTCWALWMRSDSADHQLTAQAIKSAPGLEIRPCQNNPDLQSATNVLGLNYCF